MLKKKLKLKKLNGKKTDETTIRSFLHFMFQFSCLVKAVVNHRIELGEPIKDYQKCTRKERTLTKSSKVKE